MTLLKFEAKKLLFTNKGAILIVLCLLLKILLFSAIPEMKDDNIKLSQKQYNKYLQQIFGETSPEKIRFIFDDYSFCSTTIDMKSAMLEKQLKKEISESEYNLYTSDLNDAELRFTAVSIFNEKALQFAAQPPQIAPAHFIYEYSWQTIFIFLLFPDIFLLFALIFLTSQSMSAESESGMLPVLLAAKNGRRRLYFAKLKAVLAIGAVGAILFSAAEIIVFGARGWFANGEVPLYSITLFAEAFLPISLSQAYLMCLVIRGFALICLIAVFFGLSVFIKRITNHIFACFCLVLFPYILKPMLGKLFLFTHTGLLCGSDVLRLPEGSNANIFIAFALFVVLMYSIGVTLLGAVRHKKGL